jgi:hypothetical protein
VIFTSASTVLVLVVVIVTLGHITHLQQECHNSKSGIFELLVEKETFADAL